ncbi:MATE family efflux transporter [Clostridia bacterium]|nr:MATE family efflux transporter [Clostridia bacterium]
MELKKFYKSLIMLGVPIALQNLIINGLNFVDTVMIGQLGGLEIAAVGLANQVYFVFSVILFGIVSGTSVFTAQFWGDKNIRDFNKYTALGLIVTVIPTLIMSGLAFFAPQQLMGLFTHDQALIQLASRYLHIASFSYLFTGAAFLYETVMKSAGKVRFPLYVSIVAFGANTLLNYLLIFGKLGLPAMGVEGAALATVFSRIIESTLVLGLVFGKQLPGAVHKNSFKNISRKEWLRFTNIVGPVILNEALWVIGVTLYMMVYGRISAQAVTVISITYTVERVLQTLYFGIGGAAAIMIGNTLGGRDRKLAQLNGGRLLRTSFLSGLVLGILIIFLAPVVIMPFKVSGATAGLAIKTIRIMGLLMAARSFNITLITGVLRAGGDTRYCLMLDTVGVWAVALPLGALAGLGLKLSVEWVYLAFFSEEAFKIVVGYLRFKSGKWINVLTQ